MKVYKKIILFTVMVLVCLGTVSGEFTRSCEESTSSQTGRLTFEKKSREEAWQVVLNMNFCRLEGNPKDLADYLHPNIVAILPAGERLEGREACIAAWTDFSRTSTVEYHAPDSARIDIYQNTAVVTYNYDMFYIIDNKGTHASHRDMVVLIKERGKWFVVAYYSSPFPKK